ncbi:hypothetical protein [Pedobacter sp. ASV28]|uniref:hypothetical protein n=1 Tax=Pedobacter sp. ASV28 TaxID=2795123 RepID=UPI0018ED00D5|nr:hypothetical protein [Pedobacter sp. ASV28]
MEIAIAVIGLLIAWFTYQKTFLAKPKEEIENFIVHFRATQTMSKQVQQKLADFANANEAWDMDIFPNITYRMYIEAMKQAYGYNLSDQLLQKTLEAKPTKTLITSMTKSLETQLDELSRLDSRITMAGKRPVGK